MYKISELAKKVGLTRSTVLYYEKLGLVKGQRAANGYRYFGQNDLQQLLLVKELQAGGLSLKECAQVLQNGIQQSVITQKLANLETEITAKLQAKQLLNALLGKDDAGLRSFHNRLEAIAPSAHNNWLLAEGFEQGDALRLRWLSRNLHAHEEYMKDFERIFSTLDRHGPGTEADTLWALKNIKSAPKRILDIGCGTGASSIPLAQNSHAQIVSLDNFQSSLAHLRQLLAAKGLENRVEVCEGSMLDIPFSDNTFDVLWSEGSAYIMGFENALRQWRRLLQDNGYLVVSDAVWLDRSKNAKAKQFWTTEYPDMQTVQTRLGQCQQQGYKVIDYRLLGEEAWKAYTNPLRKRIAELEADIPGSQAIADIKSEIAIHDQFEGCYTYLMLVLQKTN